MKRFKGTQAIKVSEPVVYIVKAAAQTVDHKTD
jgi:hypothetical protein